MFNTCRHNTLCAPSHSGRKSGSGRMYKSQQAPPGLRRTRRTNKKTSLISLTQVVSRRNERERNRVKLVNAGFAMLRQHVPTVANSRKLSKVDTLRSAVDYIRSLQELLDSADKLQNQEKSSQRSSTNTLVAPPQSSKSATIDTSSTWNPSCSYYQDTTPAGARYEGLHSYDPCGSSSSLASPPDHDHVALASTTTQTSFYYHNTSQYHSSPLEEGFLDFQATDDGWFS